MRVVQTIVQARLHLEIIPGVVAAQRALRTNIYESGIMIAVAVVVVTPLVVTQAIVNVTEVPIKICGVVVLLVLIYVVPRLW